MNPHSTKLGEGLQGQFQTKTQISKLMAPQKTHCSREGHNKRSAKENKPWKAAEDEDGMFQEGMDSRVEGGDRKKRTT